ncbi:hypothetical protein OG900_20065 [Streptomyces sp. NBC_00433]
MITEDDVNPATLVAGTLRPPWRHDLYRALDSSDHTTALWRAVGRAAAGTGPRSLLKRMCEVHRHPEAVLTLGLELYRDPAAPPGEFAALVHTCPKGRPRRT